MIDFSKITKTLDGYDCHYFGTRMSPIGNVKLHVFSVFHPTFGVSESNYNDNGRKVEVSIRDTWVESKEDRFQIVSSEVDE